MQNQEETGSSSRSSSQSRTSDGRRSSYQGGGSSNFSRGSSDGSRTDQRTGENRSPRDFKSGDGKFSAGRTPYLGKRRFVFRKKECHYTKNNIPYVDYKDVNTLKMFVGYSGQVLASRFTGLSPKYQRVVSKAVKRARFMALLPFVGEVKKSSYRRDDRRNDFRGAQNDGANRDVTDYAPRTRSDADLQSDSAADAASTAENVADVDNVAVDTPKSEDSPTDKE